MNFVSDALASGGRIRALAIVDDFTTESADIALDHGISFHFSINSEFAASLLPQAGGLE
jgi:hypothetical protein